MTLYKLYNERLAKEVYYKVDSQEGAVQIVSYHNGDTDEKKLVDIDIARNDWNIKRMCGFVPAKVEDHLKLDGMII